MAKRMAGEVDALGELRRLRAEARRLKAALVALGPVGGARRAGATDVFMEARGAFEHAAVRWAAVEGRVLECGGTTYRVTQGFPAAGQALTAPLGPDGAEVPGGETILWGHALIEAVEAELGEDAGV